MERDAIRQYLRMFMQAVSEHTTGAEIRETEDGPVLICAVRSPFEPESEVGYQISMIPYDGSIVAAEIIILPFTDIDSEIFPELNILINRLNQYIVFGSYRLFEDDGTVMFCQGMTLDDTMDVSKANELIAKTLSVMENTVMNTGNYILRLLEGEDADTVIEDIGREE